MHLRTPIQRHIEKHGYAKTGKLAASDAKDLPKKQQPKKKGGKR